MAPEAGQMLSNMRLLAIIQINVTYLNANPSGEPQSLFILVSFPSATCWEWIMTALKADVRSVYCREEMGDVRLQTVKSSLGKKIVTGFCLNNAALQFALS